MAKKSEQIFLIICVFITLLSCVKNTNTFDDLTMTQAKVRQEYGIKNSSYYTPTKTERDEIDFLVKKEVKSAFLDKALLMGYDRNYLDMFREFKVYYDLTKDDTRILFYGTNRFYFDRGIDIIERHIYYDKLIDQQKEMADFEWKEFAEWLKEPIGDWGYNYTFFKTNWKKYATLDEFTLGVLNHKLPDIESTKLFYKQLKDKTAIVNLLTSLYFMRVFDLAYEVYDYHRNVFKKNDLKDFGDVSEILYYSKHYLEYTKWVTYSRGLYSQDGEMLFVSLIKSGQMDEGVRILTDMVNNSRLRTAVLRSPGTTSYEPSFFNLMFKYYFGGVYDDLKGAGKTGEIDRMFESRYRSFSKEEIGTFRQFEK